MSDVVDVTAAGLLFDMDGVLVSSIGSVNRCWKRWAEHYGVKNAESFQIPHGTRAVDIIQKLKPDLDVAVGLKLIEDMEIEDVADLDVLAGAKSLLESLPAERWAIVTSATKRLAIARLGVAGLPVPERFITGDMVEKGKPDPEPYRRGAELLRFAANECVVVEDAPSGVGAGVAAGCRVMGVLGTHSAKELRAAGVSWVVESLAEVSVEMVGGELRLALTVV
jgi:sugar-phosphatase